MEQYVVLDVSLNEISICVIDGKGAVPFEGKVAAEPAALINLICGKAPQAVRVGLETGATSPWQYNTLKKADLPAVLMDARHAFQPVDEVGVQSNGSAWMLTTRTAVCSSTATRRTAMSPPSGVRMASNEAEARAASSRGIPAPVRRRMIRPRL